MHRNVRTPFARWRTWDKFAERSAGRTRSVGASHSRTMRPLLTLLVGSAAAFAPAARLGGTAVAAPMGGAVRAGALLMAESPRKGLWGSGEPPKCV